MGAQIGRGGRRGFRDINVTPLVDVMLVLLVVFMVTAPLLTTGLQIDLPDVKAAPDAASIKDGRLLVTVTKDHRVLFGEDDVTDHFETALLENERVQREKELYIRADKMARYGIVAEVVAASRAAGVVSLNLLVEPETDDSPEPSEEGSSSSKKSPQPQ